MKTRKIISTLLAFALVFSLLPTAALAASAHTAHSGSCEHEGWTKLWMDGTVLMAGDTACPDDEEEYSLPAGSYWLEGDLTTDKRIWIEGEVDLCLNGHSIITSGSRDGIAVDLGDTLNLYDESGNSGVITHADGMMGSAVWCNGEFNMYGGTISGNNIPNGRLGIVYVDGKFTMAGGAITGNEAGSGIVGIIGAGTFTMTGGTISGNKVFRDGGGVYVDSGCVFEMTGGTIENNTAGRYGSNVYIWKNGTFRLGGGTIAGITYLGDGTPSGSVYIFEGGKFEKLAVPVEVSTWEGLQAALTAGGDIVLTADVTPENPYWADALTVPSDVTATLDLNGHMVDRGYTEQGFDGSVIKIYGTLTVTDSASGGSITGGFPDQYGGGVQILGGTFNLEGGSITGNSAGKTGFFGTEGLGGGVYMQSGTFNMSGGAITGNKALGSSMGSSLGRGGGVYITGGTFNFTGGTISGNDAGAIGGGVYLASTYSSHDGTINVSGGATVTDNTVGSADSNVYLEEGGVLAVTDTLTGTIGVTMQTPGVFTSGLSGRGTKENFKSDDAGLAVSLADTGEAKLGVEEYPLWVGGVQVTSANKGDITAAITAAGGTASGTASYDPDTTTLTLNNAAITATRSNQHSSGVTYNDVVYARGLALTVSLAGRNTLGDGSADYAIHSDEGSLAITGSGSLTAASVSASALWANDGISITGSTVTATDCGSDGIFSRKGVTITDSTVTASGSRYGIGGYRSGSSLTVSGDSVVTAEGGSRAISDSYSVTLNDGLVYTEGSADAKKAVIAKPVTYTVTVTPGANMTLTSGAASQTVQVGDAMERVVYQASEGYYFPEDYAVASVNGVTVTRNSFTQITVSGTPTADANITLPDPTAQTREETPNAVFTATGPDSGTLTNVTAGMTYAIDGGAAAEITGESVDLTGLAPCTITIIQPGNGTTTIDSEAQTITVTKAEAPSLTAAQPDTIGGTGSIPTTAAHEISTDGAAWTACTGESAGLAIGTYLVRVKAAGTVLASDAQQITITDSDLVSAPTITAEPQDLALTYGYTSGSLTVSAQAADGHTLSYQWYSCNSDGSGAQALSGQTGASLTIPTGMQAGETACYFCTVTATRTETGKTASADSAIASVTVGKAQLTITAINQSYPYSGQIQGEGDTAYKDPAEIAEKITVTGLQGSDAILSIVLDGQGKDVGEYDLTPSSAQLGSAAENYEILYVPGTLTITKVKASITADDLSKVYGEADPELTAAVTGAVNGEELSYTLSREAGEDVGTYAITVTFGENPNYDITAENGTLTITKAKASITADDLSKVYGEADPELTAAVTGAVNGEELAYTLSREAGEDVGTYAITVTLGENPNYDITAENGTLTINAATITITALDQRSFLGAPLPRWTAASYTVTGLVNGEKLDTEPSVRYLLGSSEVTALRATGDYQIVPYGAQAKNYEIVYVPGTLTVIYAPMNQPTQPSAPSQPTQPSQPDEPENPTPYFNPFTDVNPEDYFYDAVRWAVENKITSGTTPTTFSPYFDCTRAQMVTFLWRAAGSPAPKSTACPFADIDPNAYYYSAVLWAYETGITSGLTADTFGPNETVSRAQMVTFLWRNAGRPEPKSAVCPFEDIDPNAYYYKAVLWAYENGITYGTTDTTFSPNNPCTRAQIVAFLYRAYNKD